MKTQLDEFAGFLSADLLRRAYNTGNELAWSRQDVEKAINQLTQAGFRIIGIDVWIPSQPGPIVTGWDWSDSDAGSPGLAQSAQQFVEDFKWGANDGRMSANEPYFNLTTIEPQNEG